MFLNLSRNVDFNNRLDFHQTCTIVFKRSCGPFGRSFCVYFNAIASSQTDRRTITRIRIAYSNMGRPFAVHEIRVETFLEKQIIVSNLFSPDKTPSSSAPGKKTSEFNAARGDDYNLWDPLGRDEGWLRLRGETYASKCITMRRRKKNTLIYTRVCDG